MITKGERYREIVAVLARYGIGVVDDQFVKHEASDHAPAEYLRRACEDLGMANDVAVGFGGAVPARGDRRGTL